MIRTSTLYIAWLDYLRANRIIKGEEYMQIITLLDRKGTRSHAVQFINRMMEEHPDVWMTFKTKMRVLGRL